MNERVPGSTDPPDVRALADLDAGLPDDAAAAARRGAAQDDPRAAEVLDALAATRAELAEAGEPELPAAVTARWTAALAAERAAPHHDGTARLQRPVRRRRPLRRRVLLVAAAAAALVGVVGVIGVVMPRPTPPALSISRVDLVAVATAAVGTMDVDTFADPTRREACLRAVLPGAAGERLLGGRRVVLDGRSGVLLVLATGTRGGLHIVTVDPDCGPNGGTLLAQVEVG